MITVSWNAPSLAKPTISLAAIGTCSSSRSTSAFQFSPHGNSLTGWNRKNDGKATKLRGSSKHSARHPDFPARGHCGRRDHPCSRSASPDVLFQLRGLRVVIEGKFADHPNAEQIVVEDAWKRVRSGIAHIAAAAVYPLALRHTPTTNILEALRTSQFEGDPASLMGALRHAQEALTRDDIVEHTAKSLSAQVVWRSCGWARKDRATDYRTFSGLPRPREKRARRRKNAGRRRRKYQPLSLQTPLFFRSSLHKRTAGSLRCGRSKRVKTWRGQRRSIGNGSGKTSITFPYFSLGSGF